MTDLLLPDRMTVEAARVALAGQLRVIERGENEAERSYHDTFDGLLYSAGVSAVYERGRLVLVERDSGAERAGCPMDEPTEPVLAHALVQSPLRDALVAIVDVRALLGLVTVHSTVRAYDVLNDDEKTVVRMTLEQPAAISPEGARVALRPRVRLTAVRGYEDDLASLRGTLEGQLAFKATDQPLVDEAVRAVGGAPGGIPAKVTVPLDAAQRADAAAAVVLQRLLEVIDANRDGTIADIDAEFLHDYRVSIRRSRSVQRELRGVFPPVELARQRTEFRWLQQITGDSRDLDVYVLEFGAMRAILPESMRAEIDPLLAVLRERRARAREEMVAALRSERALAITREWGALLERLVGLPVEDRPDATRPIADLAGERIRGVYRRMVKMGRAIDASSPPEDYHELRKKGKELRYLLELFGAVLYPAEVVKPLIKVLKSLQDALGRHQDREVQVAELQSLRDEVSSRPGGAAALMAMGVLVDRLLADEQAARDQFAEHFAEFASKPQRLAVKETFG